MLTPRQQSIFDFIVTFRQRNGCSPSIPEIQREFAIKSPNGVVGHLLALETKGWIRRAHRGSRQIDLAAPEGGAVRHAVIEIPIYSGEALDGCLSIDEGALGFKPRPGACAVRGDNELLIMEPLARARARPNSVTLPGGRSGILRTVIRYMK